MLSGNDEDDDQVVKMMTKTTKRERVLKVGIMSEEAMRERMIGIATGDIVPKRSDPKIWFSTLKTASEVLCDSNRELLKTIVEKKPQTYQELAAMSGRGAGNLGRTLNRFEKYGIIDIQRNARKKRPIAKAYNFDIQARMPC